MSKTKIKFETDASHNGPSAESMMKIMKSKNKNYEHISIKKAKIKDGMFLEVEYTEKIDGGEEDASVKRDIPVHDDLITAFSKLTNHLGRIAEQYNSDGEIDSLCMNCKGFVISGIGDNEGVSLLGGRDLDSEKYLTFTSPFTKWTEGYEYISELGVDIEECKGEVLLYLFEKKRKPEAQMSMEFQHEEDL